MTTIQGGQGSQAGRGKRKAVITEKRTCTTNAITASSVAEALLEAVEQCSSSSRRNTLGLAPTALSNVTRQKCEKMCVTLPVMPMPWHLMRSQFGLTNALSGSRAWSHDWGVDSLLMRDTATQGFAQHRCHPALPRLCSPTVLSHAKSRTAGASCIPKHGSQQRHELTSSPG
jgi:hypothetical protein